MSTRFRSIFLVLALIAALAGSVAACSSDASTRTDAAGAGPTTTAAPVTVPSTVPAGTTLRVGDQLDYLKTILKLAGQDQDFPYELEYSAFVGGPAMLQAFQAGAIDSGFVASTPLIFAQAGGQEIKAVAGWASEHGSYGLLTAPGNDDIHGWADLKGKKVAIQEGTAGEAALIQALDGVDLKLSDVTPVNLPQPQITSALQSGAADAGLSVEPLTSVYLGQNPTARNVAKPTEITDRAFFVIASDGTLADKAKTAALADYIARLVRSFVYLRSHPEKVAQAVYVDTYKLPADRADEIVEENGTTSFITLPGEIAEQQQRLADLFQENGEIPQKIDVSSEFDTRFNDLVAAAAKS